MQPSPLFRWTREPEAKLLPHKLRINLQTKVATSNRVIDALVPVRYPWTRCILSLLCSDTHNLTTRKIKTTPVPVFLQWTVPAPNASSPTIPPLLRVAKCPTVVASRYSHYFGCLGQNLKKERYFA